jgi:hypothetical protein
MKKIVGLLFITCMTSFVYGAKQKKREPQSQFKLGSVPDMRAKREETRRIARQLQRIQRARTVDNFDPTALFERWKEEGKILARKKPLQRQTTRKRNLPQKESWPCSKCGEMMYGMLILTSHPSFLQGNLAYKTVLATAHRCKRLEANDQ